MSKMEEAALEYTLSDLCRDAEEQHVTASAEQRKALEEMCRRHPYFTLPAMMALRCCPKNTEDYARLSARVALTASDIDSLLRITDADGALLSNFYPPEEAPETPTTTEALDTFLDTYGQADTLPEETRLLEKILFNPVPADYALTLTDDDHKLPEAVDEQDSLLDAFLAKQSHAAETASAELHSEPLTATRPTAEADDPLSESLAMIYIRQGRYDKAYKIITRLSLNFPKKSIYFADQLRFLRKLMLNAGMQPEK